MAEPVGPVWRVGENVPWSVAWSGEGAFRLQTSVLFPGMVELSQAERPGEGAPIFGAVHVDRQRRGLAEHLCHVCGQPTPVRDRWIFPVASGGMVTLADGGERYGGNVPPVHEACARRAQRQCPHLRAAMARPVACPADEGRLIWRTDVVPGMEQLAKSFPVGVEVVMSCYRLYGEAFSRKVVRLRREEAARGRKAAP
jgi:ferredoxin